MEAWSAAGFPSASCGNSCPSIYRKRDRLLIFDDYKGEVQEGYDLVGCIATDSWSWQCGDLSCLKESSCGAGHKPRGVRRVIDVPAGRYLVSVLSIEERHSGPLFASIKLIEEPWMHASSLKHVIRVKSSGSLRSHVKSPSQHSCATLSSTDKTVKCT